MSSWTNTNVIRYETTTQVYTQIPITKPSYKSCQLMSTGTSIILAYDAKSTEFDEDGYVISTFTGSSCGGRNRGQSVLIDGEIFVLRISGKIYKLNYRAKQYIQVFDLNNA
jgi:hypothetical protein